MLTTLSILSVNQGKGIDEKWLRQTDSDAIAESSEEVAMPATRRWWQASLTNLSSAFFRSSAGAAPLVRR